MPSEADFVAARQKRQNAAGAPVVVGHAKACREAVGALQVQGSCVPGIRRWVDKGWLHSKSMVRSCGDEGDLVLTKEGADALGISRGEKGNLGPYGQMICSCGRSHPCTVCKAG